MIVLDLLAFLVVMALEGAMNRLSFYKQIA
jgi:hypothetical protein